MTVINILENEILFVNQFSLSREKMKNLFGTLLVAFTVFLNSVGKYIII